MKKITTAFAALVVVTLALVTETGLAQDKGNTAAAELTKDSQAALAQLAATAPLAKANGFEVGVGPSVVMVDEGMATTTTTTTLQDDIYAFVFSQKGLMAGLGIQGNKIARIQPK